jgi:hypothetical protein
VEGALARTSVERGTPCASGGWGAGGGREVGRSCRREGPEGRGRGMGEWGEWGEWGSDRLRKNESPRHERIGCFEGCRRIRMTEKSGWCADDLALSRSQPRVRLQVGVPTAPGAGDDDADRKRLKERLKGALDVEKRRKIQKTSSEGEALLEYVFGICKPDRRVGKLGSRWGARSIGRGAAVPGWGEWGGGCAGLVGRPGCPCSSKSRRVIRVALPSTAPLKTVASDRSERKGPIEKGRRIGTAVSALL